MTLFSNLLSVLIFVAFVFLIIGIFSPSTSLFWYKRNRSRGKSLLIYGASLLVLIVFGGLTMPKVKDTPKQSQKEIPNQSVTNVADNLSDNIENTTTSVSYAKIGDLISVGNFKYTVNKISFQKSIGTDPYMRQVADGIFLIVNLSIENIDREARMIDNSLYKLTDENGIEYSTAGSSVQMAMSMNGTETLFLKDLNPNIKKKGYLVFEVPKKDTYDLHLSGGFWNGQTFAVKLVPYRCE